MNQPRKHRRIPLLVPVEYEGFERFQPDRTLNLGPGGVFILTSQPLPVGRRVQFRFELPDLHLTVHASGRVVWTPSGTDGGGRHHPKGMGVAFDGDQEALRRLLEMYVDVEAEVTSTFSALEAPDDPPRAPLFEPDARKN
jgi:uncharacterized protein (TIGR02266 family)